jgi:hypothetical protein
MAAVVGVLVELKTARCDIAATPVLNSPTNTRNLTLRLIVAPVTVDVDEKTPSM